MGSTGDGADAAAPAAAAGRARRADAARNARLLVAAAREMFEAHGPGVALDDVAKRAGVGNATLYRHFPTRGDLLVAVYADEVTELCARGAALLRAPSAADALFEWLDGFVVHVAAKRALALAATEGAPERRTELFDRWHRSMRSTARALLVRAQADGTVRRDLGAADLLALTSAACVAGADLRHARQLVHVLRYGVEQAGPS